MKRSLFIAIAVLLIAALFVSCNADKAKEDQLFEVSIEGDSRALSVEGVLDVDVENLYWYYSATKVSGLFIEGQTEWAAVKEGKGISGANLGSFSKGNWIFCFYGYGEETADKPEDPTATAVYYQVDLAQSISKATYLTITLTKGAGFGDEATIIFNNPSWKYGNAPNTPLTLKIYLDGTSSSKQIAVATATTDANGEAIFDSINPTAQGVTEFKVSASATGTDHTFHFYVYYQPEGGSAETVGKTAVPINAKPGMTYTISNASSTESGIEITDQEFDLIISGTYDPDKGTSSATGTVEAKTDEAVTVQANMATTGVASDVTTVVFPAGSFTEEESISLSIEVADAGNSMDKFEIVGDGDVVGAINFSLDNGNVTTFNGQAVEVSTTIAKGYESVNVVYNGDGDAPTDVAYNPSTGLLSFKTTHFSEFLVVTDLSTFEAINITTGVPYGSLVKAVNALKANQTVKVLKDTTTSSQWQLCGGTIDLNGHTIDVTINNDFNPIIFSLLGAADTTITDSSEGHTGSLNWNKAGAGTKAMIAFSRTNKSLILTNVKLSGGTSDRIVDLNGSGTELIVGNGAIIESTNPDGVGVVVIKGALTLDGGRITAHSGIMGNGTYNTGDITINSGAIEAVGAGIYFPQGANLTINGGTISGKAALYIKSGTTTISGGRFISTAATHSDYRYNGNGYDCTGDAVVVDACGYPGGNPVVTITGGTAEVVEGSGNAKLGYYQHGENSATITGSFE